MTPAATGILTGGLGVPKSRLPGAVAEAGVYAVTTLQMPSPIGLTENCVNTPAGSCSPFTQRLRPTGSAALFVGPEPRASAKVDVPRDTDPDAVAVGAVYAVTVPHGHLKSPAVGGVGVRVVAGAGIVAATVATGIEVALVTVAVGATDDVGDTAVGGTCDLTA